jgi:hypothetical protein
LRQVLLHGFDLINLALQTDDQFVVLERARHRVRQQALQLLQAETGLLGALDDLQGLQHLRRITPITVGQALDLRQQSLSLVEADSRRRQPAHLHQFTYLHRVLVCLLDIKVNFKLSLHSSLMRSQACHPSKP